LENRSAEEVAEAIRGKPENLGCKTGFELIYKANTRFKSVVSFRESINEIEMK
jgi:hypothetical protein